jgi:hypothetical protein
MHEDVQMIDAHSLRTVLEAMTLGALAPYGFAIANSVLPFPQPNNERQLIVQRATPWGAQLIVQTSMPFDDGWSIGLWYGVRVDWVQAICDHLPSPAGNDIAGGTVWGLSTTGPMLGQSYILSADDLSGWIALLLGHVRSDAFAFFNQLASIRRIEADVNSAPPATLGMEYETRLIKGMLLARAVESREFEALQARYRTDCLDSWAAVIGTYDEALRQARIATLPARDLLDATPVALPISRPLHDAAPAQEAPTLLRTTAVTGFDRAGEPEIREYSDGTLEILFEFMPPLNGGADEDPDSRFERFEEFLSIAINQPVLRDDRERFVVHSAAEGTADLLRTFLETYWERRPRAR